MKIILDTQTESNLKLGHAYHSILEFIVQVEMVLTEAQLDSLKKLLSASQSGLSEKASTMLTEFIDLIRKEGTQ